MASDNVFTLITRDPRKCPAAPGNAGGNCHCRPRCIVCGHGVHASAHCPSYDPRTGEKVLDYFDHPFTAPEGAHKAKGQSHE